MKIKPKTLAVAMLLALGSGYSASLSAAPATAKNETASARLTFAQAFALASKRAPELASAQAQIDQAEAAKREAKGNLFPKLHADIEASSSTNPLNVFGMKVMQGNATFRDFGAGEFNPANPNVLDVAPLDLNDPDDYQNITSRLQLDVPIYNGGKIRGYVEMADAYVGAAEKGKEYNRQKLILDTLQAYEGVRTAKAYVDVAELGQKAAHSYVEIARKMYREGLVSKSDMLRAEVNLGEVDLKVTEARNFLNNTIEKLRTMTGLHTTNALEVTDEVIPPLPEGTIADYRQEAIEANPAIQALQKKILAARAATKVAKADYKPHFNVMLRQEWNDEDTLGGDSSYTIGGVLNWNLLDFGVRSAAVSKSAAEVEKNRAELRTAQDELSVQVDKIWRDAQLATEQVAVRAKGIGQAKEAERLERLRYEQGISTLTQLLAVQTALDKARADYVAARYKETMQRAALLFALGKLDLQALDTKTTTPGLANDL